MNTIPIFLEIGQKRAFAGAIDWPGWCRSGRDEASALHALCEYGPRYAHVLHAAQIAFQAPGDLAAFAVVERLPGNATTDFGAPDAALAGDALPVDEPELGQLQAVLGACWQALDVTARQALGKVLRTGPRGGGRDLDAILRHVLDGHAAYLARLARKFPRGEAESPTAELQRSLQAALDALAAAAHGSVPDHGPRGGAIWAPRRFVRRAAWHVLDHAWEIEDRSA
jgi:hypothetical protein